MCVCVFADGLCSVQHLCSETELKEQDLEKDYALCVLSVTWTYSGLLDPNIIKQSDMEICRYCFGYLQIPNFYILLMVCVFFREVCY